MPDKNKLRTLLCPDKSPGELGRCQEDLLYQCRKPGFMTRVCRLNACSSEQQPRNRATGEAAERPSGKVGADLFASDL